MFALILDFLDLADDFSQDSAMSEQRQIKLQKATHIKCEFDKATQKRAGVLSLKQIAQEIEDWYFISFPNYAFITSCKGMGLRHSPTKLQA